MDVIAKEGRDAFYKGSIARAIVADIKSRDGLLDMRDFADHKADWVDPISVNYRGYDVLEMPPSTQGFVALEMLNIMEGFDIKQLGHNTADYLHVVTEAKRIAFADRSAFLADRDHMQKDVLKRLLSKDYAAERRKEIDMNKAAKSYGPTRDFSGQDLGDTIYMTAADGQGNVISFIQSLFGSFGAGFVAGETGVTLQNRGSGFNLHAGPSQSDRPAQAAAAHAGAGDDHERRQAVGVVRRDGRRQPGAGARAGRGELRGLRHARPGSR